MKHTDEKKETTDLHQEGAEPIRHGSSGEGESGGNEHEGRWTHNLRQAETHDAT